MGLFGRKKFVNKCYQCSKEIDVGHVGLGGKGLQASGACPYCGAPANGEWYTRWMDGRLKEKGTYKNGNLHGPFERYFANGQPMTKGYFKDGKPDGPYEKYYASKPVTAGGPLEREQGPIWEKGTYNMGERCGEWFEEGETVTYDPC